jgi:GntR family transcriptional regulator
MNTSPLPLSLGASSGIPFYKQIEDQLAELIRSGSLPPGTRLPSFRRLAGDLLVSLITVRRAYSDLEQDGLIVRRQGQGTFVAENVAGVSRERARREAVALLLEAVRTAQRLGLSVVEQRQLLEETWEESNG